MPSSPWNDRRRPPPTRGSASQRVERRRSTGSISVKVGATRTVCFALAACVSHGLLAPRDARAEEMAVLSGPSTVFLGDAWIGELALDGSESAAPSTPMARVSIDGRESSTLMLSGSRSPIEVAAERIGFGTHTIAVSVGELESAPLRVVCIPGWFSLLPSLLGIALAIWLRQVIAALFAAIWLGSTIHSGFDPLGGFLRAGDHYLASAMADEDHAMILLFSIILGGMVGIIGKSGGAAGVARLVTRAAVSKRGVALSTWVLGLLIFFDDYASSLLIGSSMRPIADRVRVSREKLAFLVDATAAPVASLAFVSSWVGVEVGYIAEQYARLGIHVDPYWVFLQTIPYRFYPVFMLFFVFLLAWMQRDFGPMARAERAAARGPIHPSDPRAESLESLAASSHTNVPRAPESHALESYRAHEPIGAAPPRASLAGVPIAVVVSVALAGMVSTGYAALIQERQAALAELESVRAELGASSTDPSGESPGANSDSSSAEARVRLQSAERAVLLTEPTIQNAIGHANSLKSLLWAAMLGSLAALVCSVMLGALSLRGAFDAWLEGTHSLVLAMMTLVSAWALGSICKELATAQFVVSTIGDWLPTALLPAMVFLVAAGTSFATGTSWGTMGLLFPVVIPLAHSMEGGDHILLATVASILSGSVWGDHCSPISDTTIMSSLACGCDHNDHVRTQLPYALVVGTTSLVIGELATGLGLLNAPLALVVGGVVLYAIVRFWGKPVDLIETRSTQGKPGQEQ